MTDPARYADAVTELEAILAELEAGTADIDELTARVARAAELIRFCRERIGAARLEVEHIVAGLEAPAPPPDEDGPDDDGPDEDGPAG